MRTAARCLASRAPLPRRSRPTWPYYQELIDYATSSRAKFINGDVELNDETWQKYLDTLESYGMSDYIEMCQRAYNRYSALPETID